MFLNVSDFKINYMYWDKIVENSQLQYGSHFLSTTGKLLFPCIKMTADFNQSGFFSEIFF